MLGEDGKPIDGFSVDACDLIHTCNEVNRVVAWQGGSDVGEFAGKPVRLRFVLNNCDLYAFQFADAP